MKSSTCSGGWRGYLFVPVVSLLVATVVSAAIPSPQTLEADSRAAYLQVKNACVSVEGGSGVIISAEGHILTAAHMLEGQRFFRVTLDDGRMAFAVPVGANRSADIGLLKITAQTDKFEGVNPATMKSGEVVWPHVGLADKAPANGAFCFLLGHPDARINGRPAQFRFGRITHHFGQGDQEFISADSSIQPGDSGCGLFDLEERVIGIGSVATPYPGDNIFARIDAFVGNRKRMERGETWGAAVNPAQMPNGDGEKVVRRVSDAYDKLMGQPCGAAIRSFVENHAPRENGKPVVGPLIMAGALDYITMATVRDVPYVFGFQDPEIVARWPAPKTPLARPLRIVGSPSLIGYGFPVSGRHLIVKWSSFKNIKSVRVETSQGSKEASFINGDPSWDLALFDLGEDLLTPIRFSNSVPQAVEALASPDAGGLLSWGMTCDVPRRIEKEHVIGPIYQPSVISSRRAPYPRAVHHNLPLMAGDTGRPIYNLRGECIGLHVARFCRTSGLVMLGADVESVYQAWIKQGPRPETPFPKAREDSRLANAIEASSLKQAAQIISFYQEEHGKLPASIEGLEGMESILRMNKLGGVEMIYLSELSKRKTIEDPARTPIIVTGWRDGKHTVAYADGHVNRIANEDLQKQLEELGIPMPPAVLPPK